MRLFSSRSFWILVCLTGPLLSSNSLAAGTNQLDKPKIKTELGAPAAPVDPELLKIRESTNPSYPAYEIQNPESLIRKIPKEIYKNPDGGLHFGAISGNTVSADESKTAFGLGAFFLFEEKANVNLFEFNLQSDSVLNVALGKRFFWDRFEEPWKAYYRFDVINYMDAKAGLAGVIHLGHIKIRSAIGFSDLFADHDKYYAEIGAGLGLSGLAFDVKAGRTFSY